MVLASGWPPNKTMKWKDTRALMQFGVDNYFPQTIYEEQFRDEIFVEGGIKASVEIGASGNVSMLLSQYDDVKVYYEYVKKLTAPVLANQPVGNIYVVINGEVTEVIEIRTMEECKKVDYVFCLEEILRYFVNFG